MIPLVQATSPFVTGTAAIDSTLTVDPGTVTGGVEPYTYTNQWQNTSGPDGWNDIPGATALTYTIQDDDRNKYIR